MINVTRTLKLLILFINCFNGIHALSYQTIKESHNESKFILEENFKNGRIAMIRTVTVPTLEIINDDNMNIHSTSYIVHPISFQISFLGIFVCSEIEQLLKTDEYPMKWFTIKNNKIGFTNKTPSFNKLSNGRLIMLAALENLYHELCGDNTIMNMFIMHI